MATRDGPKKTPPFSLSPLPGCHVSRGIWIPVLWIMAGHKNQNPFKTKDLKQSNRVSEGPLEKGTLAVEVWTFKYNIVISICDQFEACQLPMI